MKAEIIDGALVMHGPVGFSYWDEDGLYAADVINALAGRTGPLDVRINSGGGIATEGAAIHAALSAYSGGDVTVHVEGIAASAASLIAMAGDKVVVAEGSFLMIHDPASITWGTADDHEASANVLNTMADEYAKVYARKSGKTPEEVRELMKAELWMGADAAVEHGFADESSVQPDDPEMSAFPFSIYGNTPEHVATMATEKGWVPEKIRAQKAEAAKKSSGVPMAKQKEPEMATKDPAVQPPNPEPVVPAITPDQQAVLDAADRRKAVMGVGNVALLTASEIDVIIEGAESDADAKMAAMEAICDKRVASGPEPHTPSRMSVTDDADERQYEARVAALSNTLFGTKLEGAATEHRGITLKRLAIEMAGGYKNGQSEADLVRSGMSARGILMAGGMHSTSDFTHLTADTMGRALRNAYNSRPGTWRQISRQRTATDFRTLRSVQFGGDMEMKAVNESGEYRSTVLNDDGETLQVGRYGREVNLTFELVINDDMSALSRLPMDLARGCTNLESRLAWGVITANAAMSDTKALFHADHNNLAASGAAISVATVGAGRKAMWEQRPLGASATGDDFIEAEPNLLFVPPALEVTALQFAAATVPGQDSNTNPFKSTLTPVVEPRIGAKVTGGSDTAWYLFDASLPVLEHAFLSGYEAPNIVADEQSNPKGIKIVAEHMFGVGDVEYRGAYKNAGA